MSILIRAFSTVLVATVLVTSVTHRESRAAWNPDGVLLCDVPGSQKVPRAASDGFGGAFVAWQDFRNFESTHTYLQRVTSAGEIAGGWPTGGIPVGTSPVGAYPLVVCSDGTGGCYLSWVDFFSTSGHRLQRITADGAIAPGWPQVGVQLSSTYEAQGALVPDGAGGVFATYASQIAGTTFAYIQRFTGGGEIAPIWPAIGRRIGNLLGPQGQPMGVSDGVGGVIVVWGEVRVGPKADLFAIRIASDGSTSPGWPENGIDVCTAPEAQSLPRIVSDGAGGALVAWADYRAVPVGASNLEEYTDIYAHHILPTGAVDARWPVDGLPICTKPHMQAFVEACSDEQGGMIVLWGDSRGDPDVYAQRVRAHGTIAPGWAADGNPVGIVPGYDRVTSPPAPDGMGGAYFTWESQPGSLRHARTQHLLANGQVAPGGDPMGLLLITLPAEQIDPWIIADGYGGAIVAWDDKRKGGGFDDVYALRIAGGGPTAVAVSLVSAEADPGIARLTWQVTGAGAGFAIERRRDGTMFAQLATVTLDGSGRIAYADHVPEPGRYFYRLAYTDGGARRETPEVQVDVPSAHVLSLAGFTPNPISSTNLSVAFTLPNQAAGSLALYDVTGREIAREDLAGLGPGRHALRLGAQSRVSAGVYWMRLTHGDHTLTSRGVVVR